MPTWVRTVEHLLIALFMVGVAQEAKGQGKAELSPELIYSRNRGSVVTILTFDSNKAPLGQGSGFVVAKNRIATNYHVLAGSTTASVLFNDGAVLPAKTVVAASQPRDIAIIEVETGNRPALTLGDELQLKVGQAVYAIGAPQGLAASLSNGLVSAFRQDEGEFLIQITASISPGSSGGPLFDGSGLVVGITTSRLKDGSFGFAVGAGDLQHVLKVPLSVSIALADLPGEALSSGDDLSAARALFDQKKYTDALGSFQTYSESVRASFGGQVLLCQIETRLNDYSPAVQACDAAIRLQPTEGSPHLLKATALFASGEYSAAEAEAKESARLLSGGDSKTLLALIYYAEAKYALVAPLISGDSKDTFELTLLEGSALRSGDADTYKRVNTKIVEIKGVNNGWTLFASASGAERNLDFDTALADYRKCDADDDFVDPICAVGIANAETRKGDYSSAKSDIIAALQRYPNQRSVIAGSYIC